MALLTNNPQINHLLAEIEHDKMKSTHLALIMLLVDDTNHKDKLIEGLLQQIPG